MMKNRIAMLVCTLLLSNSVYAENENPWVGMLAAVCMVHNTAEYQDTPLGKMFLQDAHFLGAIKKIGAAEAAGCIQPVHLSNKFCSELLHLDFQDPENVNALFEKYGEEIKKVFDTMDGKHC